MKTLQPKLDDVRSAADIQRAIDSLGAEGGRVVLPEMDLTLDRGLELRSHVELTGQGEKTVLRKGPGRVYPLSGYHNYGMRDVPLKSAAGLTPGMTVSVYDKPRRGFYETFGRITWVDGDWVGLDIGLSADYLADQEPVMTTAYPLVFGHGIHQVALRDVALEGNRREQEVGMGGCRGGAVYFAQSSEIEVSGVRERDYHGEGLSFQMCRRVRILNCVFEANTGNGLHPGAGSTDCLFENCVGNGNEKSGFYFCVRANHITVRGCRFERNAVGVSIGTRDCHNILERCEIVGNRGAGVLLRPAPSPVEVHSILIRECRLEGNVHAEGQGQIEVQSDAHDVAIVGNRIVSAAEARRAGMFVAETARRIYCDGNVFQNCEPEVRAEAGSLSAQEIKGKWGYGNAERRDFRHLGL